MLLQYLNAHVVLIYAFNVTKCTTTNFVIALCNILKYEINFILIS